MQRRVILGLAVAALLAPEAAPARAEMNPICARPEVLDMARDVVRAELAHLEIVASAVREIATAQRDVVSCAITVRVATYQAEDPPNYPTIRLEARYFRVRRLGGGFAIDFATD